MDGKSAGRDSPEDVEELRARVTELEARLAAGVVSAEASRHSEANLRTLLEHSPDGIAVMDASGRMLFVNRALSRKISVNELVGTNATDHMPLAQAEEFRAALRDVVSTGETRTLEVETVQSSWWVTRLVRLESEGGALRVMGIGSESTERRLAEDALHGSDEKVRLALEAARMGLWWWEPEADILALDAASAKMFGLSAASTRTSSRRCIALVHPDDQVRVEEAAQASRESGIMVDLEFRLVTSDGSTRWLLASGKRNAIQEGTLRMSGGVFDVTERRRLEDHLRQAQKMEAVGQLTAGIAHNFNNLLAAIIPSIQLVRRKAPPAVAGPLEDAEYAARRAAELIRQLMIFSRPARSIAKEPVDVHELISRMTGICRATFDHSIHIELLDRAPLPAVMGDPGQLEQAFMNVLLNARDALEPLGDDKRIQVALDVVPDDGSGPTLGPRVRVRISDNGHGMTEDVRLRVFEPFFTTKERGRGSGLGLATTQAITAEHGGSLFCLSQPGVGTTFTVLLPATTAAAVHATPTRWRDLGGVETIMVVDDERLVRKAVRGVLEPAGYTVHEAADGPSALALFRRERMTLDVILLDSSTSGEGGDALIANVLREQPKARVILLTGDPPPSAPLGAAAVLQKPFEVEELLRVVRDVCDTSSPT